MRIFALDCATPSLSLALLEEDHVMGELTLELGRHHAEVLLVAAERLLSLVGWTPQMIGLLACTVGPGSFTGLRIGVSTIKGLALALQKPIAAISSLEALAEGSVGGGDWLCPLIDARKSQVYTALYRRGPSGNVEINGEAQLMGIDAWLGQLPSGNIRFLGDGAICHRNLILETLGKRACIGAVTEHRISAGVVGRVGLRHHALGQLCNALNLSPAYLQPSSAEVLRDPVGKTTGQGS